MNELLLHALPPKVGKSLPLDIARQKLALHKGTSVFLFGADGLPLASEFLEKSFVFLIETKEDLIKMLSTPGCTYYVRMPGSSERDFFHKVASEEATEQPLVLGRDVSRSQALKRAIITTYFLEQERVRYPELLENILGAYPAIQKASLFDTLSKPLTGVHAIVVGAGPTLAHSLGRIASLQGKAVIIAGGSAIPLLSRAGILIDLAVALDPNEAESCRLRQVSARGVPLLFSGRLDYRVHSLGFDPVYVALQTGGIVEERIVDSLGIEYQDTIDRESSTVTSLALDAAYRLGCSTITLVGVDLSFTGDNRYPEGSDFSTESESYMESIIVEGRRTTPLWERERAALNRQIEQYGNVIQVRGALPLSAAVQKDELKVNGISFGSRLQEALRNGRHTKQCAVRAVLEKYEASLNRCGALYNELEKKPHLSDVIQHDLSVEFAYDDLLAAHDEKERYLRKYLAVFKKMKNW